MGIVWLNGRYLRHREARIPAADPVVRWGVGVFEVVRGYGRVPFRLEDHLARLSRCASQLGIDRRIPDLRGVIERLFARNGLDGGRVRITLTGGGRLLVEVRPHEPLPPRAYTHGARLDVAEWRRDPRSPLAGVKSINYHELVLTRERAARRGAIDALLLDPHGSVLEGARSNVFSVHAGVLWTPGVERGVLPGVTRGLVLGLAAEEGIETAARPMTLEELTGGDEVLVTSTMMEVVPVARIGTVRIGRPGPVTRRLQQAYRRRVERECAPRRSPSVERKRQ